MMAQSGRSRVVSAKVTGTGHAGLFIGGSQDVERFFQLTDIDIAQGIKNKGKKAFHVGGAEAVQLVFVLGEGERIAGPAAVIKGNGIRMAGEKQAASAVAGTGQHIEFVARIWHRLHFDIEADFAEPAGE
ncbi:Uncharacterised protein [Raoultella ornithinolytica]|nr:Uncharacterised protein [Raoultella ornithinolytica]